MDHLRGRLFPPGDAPGDRLHLHPPSGGRECGPLEDFNAVEATVVGIRPPATARRGRRRARQEADRSRACRRGRERRRRAAGRHIRPLGRCRRDLLVRRRR